MERTQLFDLMGELKLYGMKAAFDEIMATAVKRQHEPQRIVGDLLTAEVNEKQARSIRYQLTIAKLPLAKDLDDFEFEGTPINETLVARSCRRCPPCPTAQCRAGRRNRDRQDSSGHRHCAKLHPGWRPWSLLQMSSIWSRMDFIVLDELGYLPFRPVRRPTSVPPRQPTLRTHLDYRHD